MGHGTHTFYKKILDWFLNSHLPSPPNKLRTKDQDLKVSKKII